MIYTEEDYNMEQHRKDTAESVGTGVETDADVVKAFVEPVEKKNAEPEDGGVWRTIRGRRVQIKDGETPTQAVARDIKEQGASPSGSTAAQSASPKKTEETSNTWPSDKKPFYSGEVRHGKDPKPSEQIWYHGTSLKNYEKIKSTGRLEPQIADDESLGKGVWLTLNPREAMHYGDVVIEIPHKAIRGLPHKEARLKGGDGIMTEANRVVHQPISVETISVVHSRDGGKWSHTPQGESPKNNDITKSNEADLIKAFSEEDHPRDNRGRFATKGEAGAAAVKDSPSVTKSPAFKNWFGKSAATENGKPGGTPKVLFHGSTHDFKAFDPTLGNPENHFGKAIYLTDSKQDVDVNYAGEGPDLTNRIEREAERILQDKGVDFNSKSPEYQAAKEEAKQKLGVENRGAVYPVYAKLENPVIITPNGGTRFEPAETYDEKTEEYTENPDSSGYKLWQALQSVGNEFSKEGSGFIDGQAVFSDVMEKLGGELDGATAYQVVEAIRGSENAMYATDDDGNMAVGDLIRRVFEEMGHDGIIMDASHEFAAGSPKHKGGGGMMMESGVKHYIVFDPTHVKSAIGNKGTFNPDDEDITKTFDESAHPRDEQGRFAHISTTTSDTHELVQERGELISGGPAVNRLTLRRLGEDHGDIYHLNDSQNTPEYRSGLLQAAADRHASAQQKKESMEQLTIKKFLRKTQTVLFKVVHESDKYLSGRECDEDGHVFGPERTIKKSDVTLRKAMPIRYEKETPSPIPMPEQLKRLDGTDQDPSPVTNPDSFGRFPSDPTLKELRTPDRSVYEQGVSHDFKEQYLRNDVREADDRKQDLPHA